MLTSYVQVYVPSTRHSVPITSAEHDSAVDAIAGAFSREFGGATAQDGIGFWESQEFGIIREPVTIVTCYHEESKAESALALARQLACDLKARFEQEAVTVGTEHGIEFV